MSSYYDDASLMLLASGGAQKDGKVYSVKPTDGSGDFTFTRGSNLSATRVDASQLIEKGRENVLLQSNSFDVSANWLSSNVSETGGQAGYDGTNNAWLVDIIAGTLNQRTDQSITANGVITFSVYAKAGSLNWISLRSDAPAVTQVFYDLSTGSIGSSFGDVIDSSIEDVGGGWYRCSMTIISTLIVRIYLATANGNTTQSTGNIYIQDAQIELGLAATPYIETGASTAQAGILENTPRFDYSGGATCPSLLLEPSRTNLVTQSEYFGSSYWTKTGSSVVSGFTSPEGLSNAYKLVEDTSTGSHYITISPSLVVEDYSFSVFAKQAERRYLVLRGNSYFGSPLNACFDLQLGTVIYSGGTLTSTIESYANGFYKLNFPNASTSNGARYFRIYTSDVAVLDNAEPSYQGDGTSGVYIFGAMLELGSYPTSYIPTYGVSQTRGADACSKTGIADLLNDSEGVFMVEFKTDYRDAAPRRFSISDGTTNNRVNIYASGNNINGFIGGTPTTFTTSLALGEYTKVAFKYKSGDNAFYVNGTQIGTSTDTFTLTGLSRLGFDLVSGANLFFGDVKQTLVFPTALSNLDLAILTGATTYNTFAAMALALNYTVYE